MSWYLQVLRKYADFSGRAERAEYWVFNLVNAAIAFMLGFVGALDMPEGIAFALAVIAVAYVFAMFLPGLAVQVRRRR